MSERYEFDDMTQSFSGHGPWGSRLYSPREVVSRLNTLERQLRESVAASRELGLALGEFEGPAEALAFIARARTLEAALETERRRAEENAAKAALADEMPRFLRYSLDRQFVYYAEFQEGWLARYAALNPDTSAADPQVPEDEQHDEPQCSKCGFDGYPVACVWRGEEGCMLSADTSAVDQGEEAAKGE